MRKKFFLYHNFISCFILLFRYARGDKSKREWREMQEKMLRKIFSSILIEILKIFVYVRFALKNSPWWHLSKLSSNTWKHHVNTFSWHYANLNMVLKYNNMFLITHPSAPFPSPEQSLSRLQTGERWWYKKCKKEKPRKQCTRNIKQQFGN